MIRRGVISRECVKAYWKQYPESACGYCPPDGGLMVSNLENGKTYFAPDDETNEKFMDRLEKSEKEKKNLFFEKWEEKTRL